MKYFYSLLFLVFHLNVSEASLVTFHTDNSFKQTIEKVEKFIKEKNLTLFSVIDHKKNATQNGFKIHNNMLYIFGNPMVGTPLIKSNPTFGIDLPIKLLIYSDAQGKTFISYNKPEALGKKHIVPLKHSSLLKMTKALQSLKKTLLN